MEVVWLFGIGLVFSYVGSIPPGAINISVLQYGLEGKRKAAIKFGLAASMVEFFYAAATVRFQLFLNEHTFFTAHFQIISAIVLLTLGIANLASSKKTKKPSDIHDQRGFRKGLFIGFTNLMVIPFWLGVTAYLQNTELINLHGNDFLIYVTGISAGTFLLMLTVANLSHRFKKLVENQHLVSKVPGFVFLSMGLYSFYNWLILL